MSTQGAITFATPVLVFAQCSVDHRCQQPDLATPTELRPNGLEHWIGGFYEEDGASPLWVRILVAGPIERIQDRERLGVDVEELI
jgi:hypothetical protein